MFTYEKKLRSYVFLLTLSLSLPPSYPPSLLPSPLSARNLSVMFTFSLKIQTIEMMTIQKITEDMFAEFFSNTTVDNYAINVREVQSELQTIEVCLDVLEKLTRMTDSIAKIYLEEEENSTYFMDRFHISSYFEERKEVMMSHPVFLNVFHLMNYPAKEVDTLYKLINEVAIMKVIKMHTESTGAPVLLSTFYQEKNQDLTKKQIFKPSLPYITGSVIASVDLIVVCESLDCSPNKNYIYWNFEGCMTDEEINWKTKHMQLVR